ncbi:MAG: DUF1059 domain-containing protein [Candidatus Magasanikiibacteriota bacterium]
MKFLACQNFNNNCSFVTKGNNTFEVVRKIDEHIKIEHPNLWKSIKELTMTQREKMMAPQITEKRYQQHSKQIINQQFLHQIYNLIN